MNFTIGFEKEDKKRLYSYFDDIIAKERWSEGEYVKKFEELWAEYVGTNYAVAFSSWWGAALAALNYYVKGKGDYVGCPSNTFAATPMSIGEADGYVKFYDCNKMDLCLSYESLKKIGTGNLKALWVVHVGGHIAFDINLIRNYCIENEIILIEDCAHAHGASWNGQKAGTWGSAGIYSFGATKTISTAEGGMLVTDDSFLVQFAREFRNYGKPSYEIRGGNYRMNEYTAAKGCIQVNRIDEIVQWKSNYIEKNYKGYDTVTFPVGMKSGYYKFVTFDYPDSKEVCTGKVYDKPCHRKFGRKILLPSSDWISTHHWCLATYYKGDEQW